MSFISDIGDFTNPAAEEECEGKQGEEGCARENQSVTQKKNDPNANQEEMSGKQKKTELKSISEKQVNGCSSSDFTLQALKLHV